MYSLDPIHASWEELLVLPCRCMLPPQPRNPGDNSRKKFRDGLRRRGLLPPDTSDSEPGSDSNTSNLSPDDPIFDGARDSDDTHDWNPELKKQLKHFRVILIKSHDA